MEAGEDANHADPRRVTRASPVTARAFSIDRRPSRPAAIRQSAQTATSPPRSIRHRKSTSAPVDDPRPQAGHQPRWRPVRASLDQRPQQHGAQRPGGNTGHVLASIGFPPANEPGGHPLHPVHNARQRVTVRLCRRFPRVFSLLAISGNSRHSSTTADSSPAANRLAQKLATVRAERRNCKPTLRPYGRITTDHLWTGQSG